MQEYFANFIKTGNPNGKGLADWPTTHSSKPSPVMYLDVDSKSKADPFAERYTLLESMIKKN
jgi:para-nitrobenzyl esterase